jgi:hypothetical protein
VSYRCSANGLLGSVVPICGGSGCWWKKWLCSGGVVAGEGFGYAATEVVAGEGFDPTELPIFAPDDGEC